MRRLLVMALLAGILPGGDALGEVSLSASLDREQIYLGETVTLTVQADGINDTAQPSFAQVRDCTVVLVDSSVRNIEQMSIVNGRRTVIRFHGRIFTYQATPTRTGRIRLGPITVEQDGQTATEPGRLVQVTAPEPQTRVIVTLEPSRTEVVRDESFEIVIRVLLERLPAPYADEDPIAPRASPMLTAPFINDRQPDGLEGPSVRGLLADRVVSSSRQAGFGINNIALDNGASMFSSLFDMQPFRQQLAMFRLDREAVRHDGRDYFAYTLRVPYRPTTTGAYTFGPVAVKGDTIVSATHEGQARTQPAYAFAPACTVTVTDLPTAGRPPTFTGAIGKQLTATAELDTQTCREGDPLTLTVTLGGDIRIDRLVTPTLGIQTNLLRHFRVYDDTVQTATDANTRRYSYVIRPTSAGTLEVPPLAFSYFDTSRRAYVTVATDPIPVRANKAVVANIGSVVGTDEAVTIGGDAPAGNALVPAPFLLDEGLTRTVRLFHTRRHVPLLLLGPLVYGLAVLSLVVHRHIPAARRLVRQRRAPRQAERALREIDVGDSELAGRACHAICRAVTVYLADRWDIPLGGLTPQDAARHLAARGVSAHDAEGLLDALRRGTAGAFAPDALTPQELANVRDAALRGVAVLEGGAS